MLIIVFGMNSLRFSNGYDLAGVCRAFAEHVSRHEPLTFQGNCTSLPMSRFYQSDGRRLHMLAEGASKILERDPALGEEARVDYPASYTKAKDQRFLKHGRQVSIFYTAAII